MTTVQQQNTEISVQRNTLSYIIQLIQRTDKEQVRLITDNSFNIDQSRIDNIRDFLILEREAVQANIDELLNASVSGV